MLSTQNLRTLLVVLFAVVSLAILIAVTAPEVIVSSPNPKSSYSEITEWTITDKNGLSKSISLPYTLSYTGDNDEYSLSSTVPPIVSTDANTFRIYSNYMDVDIYLDGEQVYCHHVEDIASFGASGNAFHFFDLPLSDSERGITLNIRCQLGDTTSYYIRPALVGSRTAMFVDDIISCLPTVILCAVLILIALIAFICAKPVGKNFGLVPYIMHIGAFVLIFALYSFLETEFALLLLRNSRFVYMAKFMLLALFVIPLFELILHHVSGKYAKIGTIPVYLSSANYFVQVILHFTGVYDLCSMMYVTHMITFVGAVFLLIVLYLSGSDSFKSVLPLIPMGIGFILDISLIYFSHPSYHNNMWFTIGMILYIIIEFILILNRYLRNFHMMVETNALKTMAYTDMLTGLGNRNAYEERIKQLSASESARPLLSCVVADVTGLKQINDTHGHSAGDTALIETAEAIRKNLPEGGFCYRTGGDEFIILIESSDAAALSNLVESINKDIESRARTRALPILLAIGMGVYLPEDKNISEFIRRVDSIMYADKHVQKQKLRSQGLEIRD